MAKKGVSKAVEKAVAAFLKHGLPQASAQQNNALNSFMDAIRSSFGSVETKDIYYDEAYQTFHVQLADDGGCAEILLPVDMRITVELRASNFVEDLEKAKSQHTIFKAFCKKQWLEMDRARSQVPVEERVNKR